MKRKRCNLSWMTLAFVVQPFIWSLSAPASPVGDDPVGVFSLPDYYVPVASYSIDVRLEPPSKTITCAETLEWRNTSRVPLSDIQLHLYWNAFRNDRSTFMLERGGPGRKVKLDDWGYCQVDSIWFFPGSDSTGYFLGDSLAYVQPDDGNPSDRTVCRVGLPAAIEPGGTARFLIKFRSRFPRTFARSGYRGDYFFAGQWFPKIGVLNRDGSWNCHQYHAWSEFFADYGEYDVRIVVPSGYVVGATGEMTGPVENGDGTVSYRFRQSAVHDFAWTADKDYLVAEEYYRLPSGRRVKLTLLLRPEHRHIRERYFTAMKYGLKYFSEWFGEYPYTTVTCVDPAWGSGVGGMEYPTFFTGGARIFSPRMVNSPEGVTIHEFGHGYWYGLVGTNEFEDAWMDEGFNTFSTDEIVAKVYGPNHYAKSYFGVPLVFPEVEMRYNVSRMSRYLQSAGKDILRRNSWDYLDHGSYRANAYSKPSLMLRTFKNLVGDTTFFRILRTYSLRFWFSHPKPEDFLRVVREVAGRDYNWFFGQLLDGSGVVDYAVASVESKKVVPPRGLGDDLQPLGAGGPDTVAYRSKVLVRRLGEVVIPVEVEIIFADGERVVESWDGRYLWHRWEYVRPSRVARVVVDPRHKIVLDVNRTNNSRLLEPNKTASTRWALRWMVWLQHFFLTAGLFS